MNLNKKIQNPNLNFKNSECSIDLRQNKLMKQSNLQILLKRMTISFHLSETLGNSLKILRIKSNQKFRKTKNLQTANI
jgi:hypothetical protein